MGGGEGKRLKAGENTLSCLPPKFTFNLSFGFIGYGLFVWDIFSDFLSCFFNILKPMDDSFQSNAVGSNQKLHVWEIYAIFIPKSVFQNGKIR